MDDNEILREVRANRDAYAREFDYDLTAIVADLQRLNHLDDRPVVRLPPRLPAGVQPPDTHTNTATGTAMLSVPAEPEANR